MALSETMDEVWDDSLSTAKLGCTPHQAEVCGTCCMDFCLLNQLRADSKKSDYNNLDPDSRVACLDSAIEQYFASPREIQHASTTGQTQSPQMSTLLIQVQRDQEAVGPLASGRLVAYVCYSARAMPSAQETIAALMDTCLQIMPDNFSAGGADARRAAVREAVAVHRANRKAVEEIRNSGAQVEREYEMDVIRGEIEELTDEMVVLLVDAKVESLGIFFDELFESIEGLDAVEDMDVDFSQMGSTDEGSTEQIPSLDNARGKKCLAWWQFILKQSEDDVPLDDVAAWSQESLLKFLRKHEVNPMPVPAKPILVKVAKLLVSFCLCSMEVTNTMPDDDNLKAMEKQIVGTADD